MTDNVNVPLEVDAMEAPAHLCAEGARGWASGWNACRDAMLAAAPKAEPFGFSVDDLAQEIRRVDGKHDLGAGALAEALMPFLCRAQPEAPKQEPVAWMLVNAGGGEVITRDHPGEWPSAHVYPLYRHPAPASDELLEAADFLADRVADHEHSLEADDFYGHVLPALARYRLAKHKGPQS